MVCKRALQSMARTSHNFPQACSNMPVIDYLLHYGAFSNALSDSILILGSNEVAASQDERRC